MSILILLSQLKESGISILLEGENLKINAPKGKLTPVLVNELKIQKNHIVRFLKSLQTQKEYAAIEPVEKKEYYVLSSAQKRLYFLQQFDTKSTFYNIPYIIPWKGESDFEQLENVFRRLISRHESFRTSFEIPGEEPIQRIHDQVEFKIQFLSIGNAKNIEKEKAIYEFIRPFDLSLPPLLRVGIIKLEQGASLVLIDMHHIISDGTSEDILAGEFMALNRKITLSPPKLQYKDYAVWLNSPRQIESRRSQQDYWMNLLSGELPVLDLPTDNPRPLIQNFEGNTIQTTLDEVQTKNLKQLAKAEDITLYMLVLSLFNIMLYKLSNQEDIIVGTPVNGRLHPDIEKTIGMFVNTLPMRNYPAGYKTVCEFLQEVKKQTLTAYENQGFQFDELVEKLGVSRDTSRNPVFDIMCNFLEQGENPQGTLVIPGNDREEILYRNPTAKFDLTLTAMDRGDKLTIELEFSTKLFNPNTIHRFIQYFKRIAESLQAPARILADIDIMTEKEKKQQLLDFNRTKVEYQLNKTIHCLFEEQVDRTPDDTALIGHGLHISSLRERGVYEEESQGNHTASIKEVSITYKEVNEKADEVASSLGGRGVLAGAIVGIMMDRSLELVIRILGILKAGGAYLPIEPGYPEERIRYILTDSNTEILLSDRKNPGTTQGPVPPYSSAACDPHLSPAYIIYTSGSTGKPKGVMVNHGSAANILRTLQDKYPITPTDTFLFKTPIVFDVSITELFGWFMGGGRLAVLEKGGEKDPQIILENISRNRVTHINFVPSMFSAFINILSPQNTRLLAGLKFIFLAGEALKPELISAFNNLSTYISVENLYGPTEATVYASGYSLQEWKPGNKIPIGKPLNNIYLYVLSANLHIQPLGVNGELCIAGEGLARGYLNRPTLTSEKFVSHPFLKSVRLYLTGDLARWISDGNIEFLGRKDRQVKVRGIRIELDEIESHLLTHHAIKEAVVVTRDAPGTGSAGDKDQYICAYYVPDKEVDPNELKNHLSKKLPEYMIPTYFTCLRQIPVTSSGKIDRKTLPEPEVKPTEEYIAPRNRIEEKLVEIWAEVLGHAKETISIEANFFRLGGQSLRATVMAARIYKDLNIKLPIDQVFRTPTVKGLAQGIKDRAEEQYISINPVEKKEYYSLSSIQKRLYTLQHLENDSTAYNLPNITLLEKIDKTRMEQALQKILARHDSLRTAFEMLEDEPVQKVYNSIDFAIEYHKADYDVSSAAMIGKFIRPFDLSRAPLLRVGIYPIDETRCLFMTDIHHIISDGTSVEILTTEFLDFYNGKTPQRLYLQFKDFVEWQNSPNIQALIKHQEEYWLKELSGEIPLLNIPIDMERPPIQSFAGSSFQFILAKKESEHLKKIALQEDCSLFMVLFTIYAVMLAKLCGQEEIIVGTVTGGRQHPVLQEIIGMFVNTVALRTFPTQEKTFKRFLQEVKEKILLAYENQDYPLESLVEKIAPITSRNRNPLFDTVFNSREANLAIKNNPQVGSPGLKAKPFEFESKTTKFDIAFFCGEAGEEILLSMDYSTKLFKKETIERYSTYFKEIVIEVIENNDIELKDIIISHRLLSANTNQPEMELDF